MKSPNNLVGHSGRETPSAQVIREATTMDSHPVLGETLYTSDQPWYGVLVRISQREVVDGTLHPSAAARQSIKAFNLLKSAVAYWRGLAKSFEVSYLMDAAPRDGTHIIVFSQNGMPATVHWFEDAWHLSVNHLGDYSSYEKFGGGIPVAWMPVPAIQLP